jgi:hypothetical protein
MDLLQFQMIIGSTQQLHRDIAQQDVNQLPSSVLLPSYS